MNKMSNNMYIQASLPETFGPLKAIQKANYPFNHKMVEFVEGLAKLQKRTGYSTTELLGFIENRLIFVGRTPKKSDVKARVNFRIKTDSPLVREFYENSSLSNKYLTIEICRLLISLSEIYNDSMNNMCYMIANLEKPSPQPEAYVDMREFQFQQPYIQMPMQMPGMQMPMQAMPGMQAPMQAPMPAVQAPMQAVQAPMQAPMQAPVQTPVSAPVSAPEVTSTVDDEKLEAVKSKIKIKPKAKKPVDVDSLSERAKRLSEGLKETVTDPGTTITTNPLLDDFL